RFEPPHGSNDHPAFAKVTAWQVITLPTSTPKYIASAHQLLPLPPIHDRFDSAESRGASLDQGSHRSAHNSTLVAPATVALPLSRRPAQRSRSRRSGRHK